MDQDKEKYIVTIELESDLPKTALHVEIGGHLESHAHIEINHVKVESEKDMKCHHVFPRIKMGCHLPNCLKCNMTMALMPPPDTWEWE